MNTRRLWLITLGVCFVSPAVLADELDALVALCATEPDSTEFDDRWAAYVAAHYEPGMDLDGLIEDLLARADRYRWSRHSSTGALTWSASQRQRVRQNLQATALRTIRRQAVQQQAGS